MSQKVEDFFRWVKIYYIIELFFSILAICCIISIVFLESINPEEDLDTTYFICYGFLIIFIIFLVILFLVGLLRLKAKGKINYILHIILALSSLGSGVMSFFGIYLLILLFSKEVKEYYLSN